MPVFASDGMIGSEKATVVREYLVVAGGKRFFDGMSFSSWHDIHTIVNDVFEAIYLGDIVLLLLFGWFFVPTCAIVHQTLSLRKGVESDFFNTFLFQFVDHISQAAKLALLIYFADCWVVMFVALGADLARAADFSVGFAKLVFITWLASRLCVFKRWLIAQAISRSPEKLGRLGMVDRLFDFLIYLCTSFLLLDILDVQMGTGLKSMFAVGSMGTIALGLASKDVASMFVSGLTLSTSDRISEGDTVQFGDGTCGIVQKLGWMQTTIRNFDELIEVIPNSDLGNQRVRNISRVQKCQVKQFLRFRYEDAEKIPAMLPDILEEIKEACPKIIADGSRPYRAVWTDYKEYYLQVMVDVHFDVVAQGNPYWKNRQCVMEAIRRVVRRHNVRFAMPPHYQIDET